MKRLCLILVLLAPASLSAQFFAYNGQCAKGGQNVITQNQPSKGTVPIGGTLRTLTSGVIASYPSCTVTVLLTGTPNLATIYSNASGAALASQFTANTDGSFLFFAAAGQYDVTLTGAGLPATVTLTGIQLGSTGGVGSSLTLSTNGTLNVSQSLLNLAAGPNISVADNGMGTDTFSVTGVITGPTPNSGLTQTGTTLGFQLCPNGQILKSTGTNWLCSSFVAGAVLQTNGTNNGLQGLLNLVAGPGMTIVDNGTGSDTFTATSIANAASQYAMPYYSSPGTASSLSGVAAPTGPNGIAQLFSSTPAAGVASLGAWSVPGVAIDAQTGTSYPVPITDNLHFLTGSNSGPTAWTGFALANNYAFSFMNRGSGLITYTPASGTVNGNASQIIPQNWFGFHYTDNTTTVMPVLPSIAAFPSCSGATSGLSFTTATGTLGCNTFSPGSGFTGSLTANKITKASGATALADSSMTDDGSHPVQSPNGVGLATGGITFDAVNDTSTGTAANLFVCKSATAGSVVKCPTSTTTGVQGVAVVGVGTTPGTSGSTSVCFDGICSVKTDNTTVIGDYGIPSTTVAGEIHDTGSTSPTANTDNFLINSVATAGNPANIQVLTPDWFAQQSAAKVYALQVNGVGLTAGDTVNLRNTVPAAGTNGYNITFQTSKSSTTDSVSGEIVGDGTGTHFLSGVGTFVNPTPVRGIAFTIGDPAASSALTVASTTTDYITVPFACTIQAYNLAIDAGTITVKFWKVATGTAIPTSGNSISTSGVGISSGTAIHSTTLSDFTTTTVTANDIIAMNVTAVATAKYVNGVLQCQ